MSDYSSVSLFIKVVKEGSFSSAARALGLSPSAISKQISSLENELGARLFQRTTRTQSLTEAGETYLHHAQKALATLDEAKQAVNRLSTRVSGSLHVASEPDLATHFISPFLSEFLELHPDLDLRLNLNAGVVDLVENEIDLAIRMGHLKDSSLLARKLGQSHSVLCGSTRYFSKTSVPVTPYDLEAHNCVSFRTGAERRHWDFNVDGSEVAINIKGNLRVNNLTVLKHAVLNDMGIAMLPAWSIQNELQQGLLLPVLQDYQLIPHSTPINAIYSHRQHLAPKIRAFIDFFAAKFNL